MKKLSLLALALATTVFLLPASASVLVVDASGAGNFLQIQPAVDAANDGDTILVKAGTYASFVANQKSLAIVGDAGSTVVIAGSVRVRNLLGGQTLGLQNLRATGSSPNSLSERHGLLLVNNAGRLRIQECVFAGAVGTNGSSSAPFEPGFAAVSSEWSADVAFAEIDATGGAGGAAEVYTFSSSGAGLDAVSSTVTVYDSLLRGGTGNDPPGILYIVNGASGGHGCSAVSSALFAAGSSFLGGDGGDGESTPCFNGDSRAGNGGDGVRIATSSTAHMLDDIAVGGSPGMPGAGTCNYAGAPGLGRRADGSSLLVDFSGAARHLAAPSPVRESTLATFAFSGVPGEQVQLLLARTAGRTLLPAQSGVLLLGSPMRVVNLGAVPPSGTLSVQIPMFALGSGIDSIVLHLQARFTDSQGVSVLSGGRVLVVLNQAF